MFIKKSPIADNHSMALNELPVKKDVSKVMTPTEHEMDNIQSTKKDELMGEGNLEVAKNKEINSTINNGEAYNFDLKDSEQNTFKSKTSTYSNQLVDSIALSGLSTIQPMLNLEKSVAETKVESDLDIASKNKKALADEVASVPAVAQKGTFYENDVKKDLAVAKEENKIKDAEKKVVATTWSSAETISADKVDALAGYASTSKQNNANTTSLNSTAYFTGGELEIKNQVLAYHAKIQSKQLLKGSFSIKGIVLSNKNFTVTSIKNNGKDECNCIDFLKEALNSIKNWNPAIKNGKEINSDIQFTLMF